MVAGGESCRASKPTRATSLRRVSHPRSCQQSSRAGTGSGAGEGTALKDEMQQDQQGTLRIFKNTITMILPYLAALYGFVL